MLRCNNDLAKRQAVRIWKLAGLTNSAARLPNLTLRERAKSRWLGCKSRLGAEDHAMAQSEIDAIRALLSSKPRPVGWPERRKRLDDIGSVWPVADDVKLESVDIGNVEGEWSIVPGSEASRVMIFFHGGGYCSGSIVSHRRMVTEAGRAARTRTLARCVSARA